MTGPSSAHGDETAPAIDSGAPAEGERAGSPAGGDAAVGDIAEGTALIEEGFGLAGDAGGEGVVAGDGAIAGSGAVAAAAVFAAAGGPDGSIPGDRNGTDGRDGAAADGHDGAAPNGRDGSGHPGASGPVGKAAPAAPSTRASLAGNRAGVVSGTVGFASRGIVQILLFGVTIVATRSLSVADFGAYALGSLFLVLARQLFYIGPYEYLLKERDSGHLLPACFAANMIQATVLAGILTAVWLAAPVLFSSSQVGQILAMLVPSVWLVAITAWYEAVLLRSMRVRRYYASTLMGDTVGAAVAVALLVRGHGVASLVVQTYARLLVLLVLYVVATGQRPSLAAPREAVKDVLRWSVGRHAAVMLNFTSSYGADFVLGVSLSPAATGLYRAANRIVSAMTDLFAQPLQKIAQTNLSASWKRQRDMGTSWLTMLSGVGAIAWSGLLTLGVLAHDLVPLALGAKWASAAPIVMVFCLVKAFSLLDAVTTSFLVCQDRQRAMLKVQVLTAIAVVGLGWVASPWGPQAVAVAVGAASTAMSLTYGAMVMRLSRADRAAMADLLRTSAPPVLAVGAGLLLLHLAAPDLPPLQGVIAGITVAAIAFFAGAFSVRHRMLSAIGSLGHHAPPPGPAAAAAAPAGGAPAPAPAA
jgi:O-antigen/teichoic acid export membrane protein